MNPIRVDSTQPENPNTYNFMRLLFYKFIYNLIIIKLYFQVYNFSFNFVCLPCVVTGLNATVNDLERWVVDPQAV